MRVNPGLRNVEIGSSAISYSDAGRSEITIRGRPLSDLINQMTYEQYVVFLLTGTDQTSSDAKDQCGSMEAGRTWAHELSDLVEALKDRHPMSAICAALAALSHMPATNTASLTSLEVDLAHLGFAFEVFQQWLARSEALLPPEQIMRLSAPARLVAQVHGAMPTECLIDAVERSFILISEHGANNSTFTARVVASTGADTASCLAAATASFGGPLHGAAVELGFQQLQPLTEATDINATVAEFVEKRRQLKQPVMGFGHGLYKCPDPRARHFEAIADRLSGHDGDGYIEVANSLVAHMSPLRSRGIYPNCDLFAGVVYRLLGFSPKTFNVVHTLSRIVGWLAHIREQRTQNVLIRPQLVYEASSSDTATTARLS